MKRAAMAMAATIAGAVGAGAAGAGGADAAASLLGGYVDHARVLVVSAPTPDDPDLRRQTEQLARVAPELSARDVVVLSAVGARIQAAELRAAVGLPVGRFGVALVGKDGGVKLRRGALLPVQALVQTIDAMPMRRAEMRRATAG